MLILASLFFIISFTLAYWIHNQWQTNIIAQPVLQIPNNFHGPKVSIIIPARNEAQNIRRCVEGALAQTYENIQVIVIDDQSTDATPQILSDLARGDERLEVIQGATLAKGWAGKPHALYQAAKYATGEWLCFLDADTFATPHLIASGLSAALEHKADMFSILTNQKLVTFWEKVIQPLVFTAISASHPPKRVNDPEKPDAIANGQFILIRKNVYESLGGHKAVYNSIVEDLALARIVKKAGHRLTIADGRQLASTRMYTNFAEIWEGWTKNIYLGLQGRIGWLVFGAIGMLFTSLVLPLWPFAGVIWFLNGGGGVAIIVIIQSIIFWSYLLYQRALAARAFGLSDIYAFTLPLATLVFGGMIWASIGKVLSGQGVTWKGRKYQSRG